MSKKILFGSIECVYCWSCGQINVNYLPFAIFLRQMTNVTPTTKHMIPTEAIMATIVLTGTENYQKTI